ncbi:ATP-binding cassette domain-containing protein [Spiractinospora alimapuensis]|uniref:ABC transporter ATP-binding protein n=1 Tax=Spiractinospora alimapuensis TaxID=2820884 RepID=UPI001F478FDA|nr:ATP-binding cassette domain-containing protein [Spiractinospora alimapuensis]QVQ52594.1 ATP-binding cassette domain-containing protein [Spiractinospora alimapuensis]
MSSSVELRGVDKYYSAGRSDATQVLFDVAFTANPGEFLVLLGPSGCGKSTSLRLVAGLEHPQKGDVLIDDRVVNTVPAAQRALAMVFQNYALFPHLTVEENIVFGLRVRRVSKNERAQRLQRAVELLELGPFLSRRPAQLSGGQRQRVALGRALVSGASLILMDEPLSNLDAKLRQQMRVELRQLQRDLGLTVLYVTHDQVEAMTMADRVVVMREGRVDQVDAPRALYQRPARAEVARFIGSPPMNLLDAHLTDGRIVVGEGENRLTVTPPPGLADLPDRLLLGVRPEDLRLDSEDNTTSARIRDVELLGADQLLHLDLGTANPLVARVHANTPVTVGQTPRFGVRTTDIHLFDADTGLRVAAWDDAVPAAEAPGERNPSIGVAK